jgi:hypothetical protein
VVSAVTLPVELAAPMRRDLSGVRHTPNHGSRSAVGSRRFVVMCLLAFRKLLKTLDSGSPFFTGESISSYDSESAALASMPLQPHTGVGFLAGIFKQFRSDLKVPVLTPSDVDDIFAVTPSEVHPFGSLFPDCCQHNAFDGISLSTWLNLWQ